MNEFIIVKQNKTEISEILIQDLNYRCRLYDGLTKLITASKNRLQHLLPDAREGQQDEIKKMESLKDKTARKIEKTLYQGWNVWALWMKNVPGIGPYIAGNLVLLYHYQFIVICPKCGNDIEKIENEGYFCPQCKTKMKGEGISKTRMSLRDFETISKWWKYMGRAVDENGRICKRKKGVQSNWSTKGKHIGYQIGESFNKQAPDHLYKQYLLERKAYREKTHPDSTKGHRHNMALNETIKLFLAHFWHVSRSYQGLPTESPWIIAHGGHEHIIEPYYWNSHALN